MRIGGQLAAVLCVSPGQTAARAPYEVQPGQTRLVVSVNGVDQQRVRVIVTAAAPEMFPGVLLSPG